MKSRKLGRLYGEVRAVIISTWRAGAKDSSGCEGLPDGLEKILCNVVYAVACHRINYRSSQVGAAAPTWLLNCKERIRIYGATPVSCKGRQAEVEHYIRRNNVGRYILQFEFFKLPGFPLCGKSV